MPVQEPRFALPLADCLSCTRSFTLVAAMSVTGERFERAVSIMERLRAPGGCPWDREQTFDSIKPYAGRNLRSSGGHRQSRLARACRRVGRSAAAGIVLCRDGEGAGLIFD